MPHNKKTFYQGVGVKGLERIARQWHADTDLSFVRSHTTKNERVLDLACGYGRTAIPMAKAGVQVTGIDLDRDLIREARRRAKEANVHVQLDVGNMTSLPYAANMFDKIFCLWNSFADLVTLKEQRRALAEIYRTLRPGGYAVLVLPNGESAAWRRLIEQQGGRVIRTVLEGCEDTQYIHDRTSISTLLEHTSFARTTVQFANMHKRRRILVFLYK